MQQVTPNEVQTDRDEEPKTPWPNSDIEIVEHVQKRGRTAEQGLAEWYEDAKTDFGFAETKQWSDEDASKLELERRVAVTFNLVHRTVNAICGQEVSNRQEIKFLPRRVGEIDASDPMTAAVKWFRENCNAEDEDSDAFRDMVTCGMGWTLSRMDYEVNPAGEPDITRRSPLLMRWDLSARKRNIADKKWVQSDYWMTKEAITDRWPESETAAMMNFALNPERTGPIDATENWKYQRTAEGLLQHKDEFRVVHHVERFTVAQHQVLDPASQKILLLSDGQLNDLKDKASQIGIPPPQAHTTKKRVFWEAWTVGGTVLESGPAKIQSDFQYQCMTAFREQETGYWFGVVRLMKDPQRYTNRMASLLMSVVATGAKGGFLYETGSLADPKKAKQDWARTDSAIEVNPGKLGAIQPKEAVQLPQGAADLLQLCKNSIVDIPGMNIELLGGPGKDQPGIVEDMRTKAGLTILAPVFDAKRLYVKRQGLLLSEFVTRFLSDGRLIRIWGPMGQQFIPLVRRSDVTEYDIVADESSANRDVKEKTFMVLQAVGPALMQMGVPPVPELLDYLPLPESLVLAIKKGIAQKSQQPPPPPPEVLKAQAQAQAQMQVAQVKAQAQTQVEAARTQADVQIEHDKAAMQLQLNAMKQSQDSHFQQQNAIMQAHTTILTAIINNMGKVAAAEVTASQDTDEEGRKLSNASAYPQ